jgi:hypothetical protein
MSGINLLPQELRPKTYAIKLSKTLKHAATISLTILFVALAVAAGVYFFLVYRGRTISNNGQIATNEIKTLEKTEQKLVLLHDRLEKIETITADTRSSDSALAFKEIVASLPQDVSVSDVKIDQSYLDLTVTAGSSSLLTRFFSTVTGLGYKDILLKSFFFDKEFGYRVELAVTR